MTTRTLDSIVRGVLLKKNYPIHYYIDCLVAAVDCLSTLTLDDLLTFNTVIRPVDRFGCAELPDDFVDYVGLGVQSGQSVRPLVPLDSIIDLTNFDSSFKQQNYSDNSSGVPVQYGTLGTFFSWATHFNEFGEITGRFYGAGAGSETDTFKIIPKRNQIQLNERYATSSIVLTYITDGRTTDAASRVEAYAVDCIQAYILWQLVENSRSYGLVDKERLKREYENQRAILRARKSPLTLDVLKRIVQRNSKASLK